MNKPIKIWLAPLHGITYSGFRNCLYRHANSFDMAILPFLPALPATELKLRRWQDITPENNAALQGKVGLIPQLMGNVAADLVYTAQQLAQMGYRSVNWNIGCPSGQIVKRKRGCGVMPYPEIVEEAVNAISAVGGVLFSIKMRLGWQSPSESVEIIRRLNHYNLHFIAIHPRLGTQQYEGMPDWDAFEQLLALTKHEIVYSGDVNSVADYQRFSCRFPKIAHIMLGRGALANPFLAEEIKQGFALEPAAWHKRFSAYYADLSNMLRLQHSEKRALGCLKEQWQYLATSFRLTQTELTQLLRIQEYAQFIEATNSIIVKKLYLNSNA